MITKELLSNVYDENVTSIDYITNNIVTFTSFDNMWSGDHRKYVVNIHEIAHECKKWAYSNGYEILQLAGTVKVYRNNYEIYYKQSTEPYSAIDVFSACEFVQKEIK